MCRSGMKMSLVRRLDDHANQGCRRHDEIRLRVHVAGEAKRDSYQHAVTEEAFETWMNRGETFESYIVQRIAEEAAESACAFGGTC